MKNTIFPFYFFFVLRLSNHLRFSIILLNDKNNTNNLLKNIAIFFNKKKQKSFRISLNMLEILMMSGEIKITKIKEFIPFIMEVCS